MSLPDDVPDLVTRALRTSLELGYMQTTRNTAGRLLATLAASVEGPIADYGTGSGAGAAWLAGRARPGTTVVSVEPDAELYEKAVVTLAGSGIELIHGSWDELFARGPFSLVHLDRTDAESIDRGQVAWLLADRGIAVIDEFLPDVALPRTLASVDQVRQGWLADDRFTSVDVSLGDSDVIIAVKTGGAAG